MCSSFCNFQRREHRLAHYRVSDRFSTAIAVCMRASNVCADWSVATASDLDSVHGYRWWASRGYYRSNRAPQDRHATTRGGLITLADLEARLTLSPGTFSEAIQYRTLDRNFWAARSPGAYVKKKKHAGYVCLTSKHPSPGIRVTSARVKTSALRLPHVALSEPFRLESNTPRSFR